jgi:hypothetical protein
VAGTGKQRDTLSVLHLVHGDVFLKHADADQIVVVLVAIAPHQTATLHLVAGYGLHAHADVAVAKGHVLQNCQWNTIGAAVGGELRQDVG